MTCEHKDFAAHVSVNRLEDSKRFQADVTIHCSVCGKPFRFIGLPLGLNLVGAAMSVDGREARLAIAPEGELPPLPDGTVIGFTVPPRRHDS